MAEAGEVHVDAALATLHQRVAGVELAVGADVALDLLLLAVQLGSLLLAVLALRRVELVVVLALRTPPLRRSKQSALSHADAKLTGSGMCGLRPMATWKRRYLSGLTRCLSQ